MLQAIARIVRNTRLRAALSPEQVASESGIDLDRITALERGEPGVTTTTLFAVARVLGLDPVSLLGGQEEPHPVPSVYLRHCERQDFDDRDHVILDEALDAGRALASLRDRLGEPPAALQAAVFEPLASSFEGAETPARQGYRLAALVRRWLGNPSDPLADLGVLIEEVFGVAVLVRALVTTRSTAASVRAGMAAGIVLNGGDPHRLRNPLLARVHLAHELCHLLFDETTGGVQIIIDLDGDRRAYAAEQRARAFAAELLLPLPGLVGLLGDPTGVADGETALRLTSRARSHFGTSHEITANHLGNLGFIDHGLRNRIEAGRSQFHGSPPGTSLPPDGRPSLQVSQCAQRAHDAGLITDGEARALLGIDRLDPLPWDDVAP